MISPSVAARIRLRPPAGRRGTVLVLFAIFLFVLLPLLALVIDMSLVSLTRRQMQSAVNAGALEGLRVRDDDNFPTHADKRERVRLIVRETLRESGAGPHVEYENGIPLPGTDFQAGATVRAETLGPYVPADLALNLNPDDTPLDDYTGDMAAGQYSSNASDHREGPVDDGANDPELDEPYERKDFKTATSQTGTGNDYDAARPDDAFLVRLRRVSGEVPVSGVSTVGPPVPFLFGRGPYGNADGGPELLNGRERGTHVRATAIASTVPALTVGSRDAADSRLGALNLQLNVTLLPSPSGTLPIGGDLATNVQVLNLPVEQAISVGRAPFPHDGTASIPSAGDDGYLILTDEINDLDGNPLLILVGFSHVTVSSSTATTITFAVTTPAPVGTNVSSQIHRDGNAIANLDYGLLIAKSRERHAEGKTVSAPALARSIP